MFVVSLRKKNYLEIHFTEQLNILTNQTTCFPITTEQLNILTNQTTCFPINTEQLNILTNQTM
jgi:hypothetical protein